MGGGGGVRGTLANDSVASHHSSHALYAYVLNPLFKLVMSLLKCTGCNNIHVLCIQSVE